MITVGTMGLLVILLGALLLCSGTRSRFHVPVTVSDLWRWDGVVDRGAYALIGLAGLALKHNMDRFIASFFFHRPWGIFNYWIPPTRAVRISALSGEEARFLATMLVAALPFIWTGIVLTMRRLRAAGLPLWLIVVFFAPVINLAFFLILSLVPSRDGGAAPSRPRMLARIIPDSALGSAATALLLMLPLGLAATGAAVTVFGKYGWGVFVALPFCAGLGSALLYGYHRPRSLGGCLLVSMLSVLLLAGALAALAVEGVVCLFMAAPLALVLALIGGSIGYVMQSRPAGPGEVPAMMLVLLLFPPVTSAVEWAKHPAAPAFEVHTMMEIGASPEVVWRRLVEFPDLPAPKDWLFRAGVAYPVRATLDGASRQCLFSTGLFVEPIEIWDEPRLLQFSVASGPEPMRELSPYPELHPRHLASYLRPERGRFQLTALPGGRTLLEGTSWYRNEMWPAAYWRQWSDRIIHRIHLRVFEHIKGLAEQQARMP